MEQFLIAIYIMAICFIASLMALAVDRYIQDNFNTNTKTNEKDLKKSGFNIRNIGITLHDNK